MSTWAAKTSLEARLVHYIVYTVGIPVARTLASVVGIRATLLIAAIVISHARLLLATICARRPYARTRGMACFRASISKENGMQPTLVSYVAYSARSNPGRSQERFDDTRRRRHKCPALDRCVAVK